MLRKEISLPRPHENASGLVGAGGIGKFVIVCPAVCCIPIYLFSSLSAVYLLYLIYAITLTVQPE